MHEKLNFLDVFAVFDVWLKVVVKFNLEYFCGLYIKCAIVTNKMIPKLALETKLYMDFQPGTFCQFLEKTLYV